MPVEKSGMMFLQSMHPFEHDTDRSQFVTMGAANQQHTTFRLPAIKRGILFQQYRELFDRAIAAWLKIEGVTFAKRDASQFLADRPARLGRVDKRTGATPKRV